LDKYSDSLGKPATNRDVDPFVDELTKLQDDAIMETWWQYSFRQLRNISLGVVVPQAGVRRITEGIAPKQTGTKSGFGVDETLLDFDTAEPVDKQTFENAVKKLNREDPAKAREFFNKWESKFK